MPASLRRLLSTASNLGRVQTSVSEAARALHASAPVTDLHTDTLLLDRLFGYDPRRRHAAPLPLSAIGGHADVPRLREGGVRFVVLGLVVPYWGGPSFRRAFTRRYLARYTELLADPASGLAHADDLESVNAAHARGLVASCLGMEGAHALGGDLSFLAECHRAGVRAVGLTHFAPTEAAVAAQGFRPNRTSPLTDFGRDLVDECNRLGVVLDLAHVNRAGFFEALKRTRAPAIVSHTGVRARFDSDRNLDDEMIRAVARNGGTVGIIFTPQWLCPGYLRTAEEIALHAEHVRDLVGPDHVSFGSDFDGFVSNLPVDMRGAEDYPLVTEYLLRRGWKDDDVRKALGLNALRVFGEARRLAAKAATTA